MAPTVEKPFLVTGSPMAILRKLWKPLLFFIFLAGFTIGGFLWYRTSRPDYLLKQGQEALRKKNLEDANRIASKLKTAGHQDHAHLLLGEIFYRTKSFDLAEAELTQIERDSPLFPDAVTHFGYCQLLRERKNYSLAAWAFKQALELQPEHLEAHRGLADVLYTQGAMALALEEMKVIARLDPKDGRSLLFMGRLYDDVGRKYESIESYEEALKRELSPAESQSCRKDFAEVLVKNGGYDRALQLLDELDPAAREDPVVFALRAECLIGKLRQDEARALLDRAVEKYPNSMHVLGVAGRMKLQNGEAVTAVEFLERAIALDPFDQRNNHYLAIAYEGAGRREDAERQRKKSQQIKDDLDEMTNLNHEASFKPWDAEMRLRLAEVMERLGKPQLAEMWRNAAEACKASKGEK